MTLDKAIAGGLTVTPSFTDGTATGGTDYTGNTTALTFTGTAGETKTFTVATTEDTVAEADETFTVGLAVSGTTADVTDTDTATGTITNDDTATLGFDSTAVSVTEGGKASLTVELSNAASSDVTFSWQTAHGTAESSDYTAQAATNVTIAAGSTSATLEVQTAGDELVEGDETFTVTISASGLPAGVTLGADASATVTVTEDDAATLAFDATAVSVAEGGKASLTVELSQEAANDVTFSWQTAHGTAGSADYTAQAATNVTIDAGDTSATLEVQTATDELAEGGETFTATISASTLPAGVTLGTDATATVTITDDDGAAVTVADAAASEGDAITFTVTLDNAVPGGLKVTPSFTDGTAVAGTDYTKNTAALTFAGTAGETKTFTVATTEDTTQEHHETFTVGLAVSGTSATVTDTDTATGTINNDDGAHAAVTVADVSAAEGDSLTFTVTLDKAIAGGLTVTPSFTDGTATGGTDYTGNTTALTFTGTAGETKTFTVATTEDTVAEADETFTVGLAVSGTTADVTDSDTATGTITNDDTATLGFDSTAVSVTEGGKASLTVELSNAASSDVTFSWQTAHGTAESSDYTAQAATNVTIAAGSTSATLEVQTAGDELVEGDETFTVTISASGLPAGVTLGADASATVTVTEDDAATLAFDATAVSVAEGGKASLTVELSQEAANDVTFSWQTAHGTAGSADYTAQAATNVTIDAGDTSATLEVQTATDELAEGGETFTATISASTLPAGVTLGTDATATVTITDDDGAAVTVADAAASEGDAITFTVTLDNAVPGGLKVTPSFTDGTAVAGTDYTKNTAALTFAGTAGETKTFTVATTEDTTQEHHETFTVGLAVSGTSATVTDTDTATGTINNDDGAHAAVTVADVSAAEGDSLTFTVTLDKAIAGGLTVTPSFTDGTATGGTDYTGNTTALTFTGTAGETKTFTVATTEDTVAEADETFTVGLAVSGTTADVTDSDTATGTITNDDTATVSLVLSPDSINENGGSSTVTASLSAAASVEVTVTVSTAPVSPAVAADVTQSGTELTIAAGATASTGTVTLTAVNNDVAAADKQVTVSGAVTGHAGVSAPAGQTLTVTEDDAATLAFDATAVSVAEGGKASLTVELSQEAANDVTFSWQTAHGTAGSADYTAQAATNVTIDAGDTSATLEVQTATDELAEGGETFTATISASTLPAGVTLGTDATATVTITDDDGAAVTVADAAAEEGDAITFTVTLDNAVPDGFTVTPGFTDGTAVEGTDYTENTAALTFAGTAGETQSFTVSTAEDTTQEHHETFTVGLAVSGTSATVTDTDTATGTINNDDGAHAAVTIEDVSAEEGDALTFKVTLDNAVTGGLTVTPSFTDGTATGGTDYTANTGALKFTGTAGQQMTFLVATTEDTVVEADETFTVGLAVSGTTADVTDSDTATGTITNDDETSRGVTHPAVTIADVSAAEGDALTFTVTLDQAVSGGLTVTPSFTDGTATKGTDYTENTAALTFAGTSGEAQSFTVSTTEDADEEEDETFSVGLTVSGTSETVTATDTATGTITNDDDDGVPTLRIADASASEGDAITFTVELDQAVSGGLTVTPSFTDGTAMKGTDYTENTTALTFTGTANETRTFTVATTEDADEEEDETFTVGLTVSGSTATVTATDTATGTITNDDETSRGVTHPAVTIADVSAAEGDALTFTVTLDQAVSGGLTVTPSFTDGTATKGTDYTENTAALTFAGTSGETKSFTVSTTEDTEEEEDETFTVGLAVSGTSEAVTATDTATGTITNDDDDGVPTLRIADASASEGDAITFTVKLDQAVSGGLTVTPSFTDGTAMKGTDYTENTTALTFTGTANETRTFTVATTEDADEEEDETFTVGLTVSGSTATVTATDTATGTITNDDERVGRGVDARITIMDASAAEGDALTFELTLNSAVPGGLKATPMYIDGTATAGTDYTRNTTALSFNGNAGETKSFTVSTTEDADEEEDETFTVGVTVSGTSETVTATDTATGTITNDDDDGVPTLRIADASASEGDAITFTVELDQAVPGGLTVTPGFTDVSATEGTDYSKNIAALAFIGAAGETKSFTVATTEDTDEEADETFTVDLRVSVTSEPVTATDTATGTITDDDGSPSGVTLGFHQAAVTVTEGGTAVLTVLLSQALESDVTFTCMTVDGTAKAEDNDYTPTEETVTIKAGDTSPSSAMRIPILTDTLVEGDENFEATLDADNLPDGVGFGRTRVTITISDATGQSPDPTPDPVTFDSNRYVFHLPENRSGRDRPVYLGNVRAHDGAATYEMVRGDGNRFAVSSGSGLVRYVGPGEDYESGPNEFELEVEATNGQSSATVSVLVRVVDVPEAPVAEDDLVETPEDVPVVIDVLDNDRDPDGDRLSVTAVSAPKHGTLTVEDGGVRYASEPNWFGEDRFTYTVSDPGGLTDEATVRVTVTPVNDPPDAVDDEAETPEDVPVIVNVLANDSDVDGDPIRIVAVGAPENGTTAVIAGGVIYASAPDWNGTDRFTYTIADPDGLEDTATVTMTVIPVNDPPVAVGVIPDQALEEGGTELVLNLTEYFHDVDGDVLTYVAESSDETAVTASVFGPVLTLKPVVTGTATITVTATDVEGLTAVQTFGVHVGDEAVRGVLTDALAALGRAHLSSSGLTIGRRLEAGGGGANRLMLAGQHLSLDTWERIGAGGLRQSQEVLLRAETYRQRTSPLNPFGLMQPWPESPESSRNAGGTGDWQDRLLRGTDVLLSFGGGEGAPGGGRWTVWGQGDVQTFAGSPGESVNYDGDLRTAYVGVDTRLGSRWLAGVALSRSAGGGNWNVGPSGGRLGTVLTAVHPYARWSGSGTTVSAMAGVGRGTSENTRTLVDRPESSGLSLGLGQVDARRNLATTLGGLQIDLRGEAAWARLSTGAGEESVDRLAAGVHRLRTGLEAELSLTGPLGLQITPFGAVSTRRDGGAGQTGFGLEFAGGLRMSGGPVRLDAQGRMLALHSADEYQERGISVTATIGGGQHEPGLSASLRPRWGAPGMGAETLWQDQFQEYTRGELQSDAGVDGRIGYGVQLPYGLLLTPFGGYGQTGNARRIQFGANLGMVGRFSGALDSPVQIEFLGERSTRPEGAADLRMSLHAVLNFGSSPRKVPEAPTRGPNTIRQASLPRPE